MKTLICPTCGCSLVRLGISKDKAAPYNYNDKEHFFCCRGCADLFVADPEQHLQRTKNVIVCPTCLGEKPPASTFTFDYAGQEVHYCGCPYCRAMFQKDPDYYIKRLEGTIPQAACSAMMEVRLGPSNRIMNVRLRQI